MDTPSRLPPGAPRAPGVAARECDRWLREQHATRMSELRRALLRGRRIPNPAQRPNREDPA